MPAPSPPLDDLLAIAVSAARAAGGLLLDGLHHARRDVSTKSSSTDMVTEMDRGAEALVVDRIHAARPDDGFLGEEGSDRPAVSGVRWIIDPLDGTTNYLYGIRAFSVSIAAEIDGTVCAGAVFDPSHDELFTATLGGGAYRNGEPLTAPAGPPTLATALVGTGFSYRSKVRAIQGATLAAVLPAVRDIRRAGSAALDLCSAACGRLDAYYELGLMPWDVSAGALIASEAGLVVTTLGGGLPPADVTVAAPPHLVGPLLALLESATAPR